MGSSSVKVMYAVYVDHDALWSVKVRNVTTVLDDETGPFDFLIWFFLKKEVKSSRRYPTRDRCFSSVR